MAKQIGNQQATADDSRIVLKPYLYLVAVACLVGAAHRFYTLKTPDEPVLYFLLAAAVIPVLESVTKLKFMGLEVERQVQQLQDRVDEITEVALDPGSRAPDQFEEVEGRGQSFEDAVAALQAKVYTGKLTWDSDPVRERFPDEDRGDHQLMAQVTHSVNRPGIFKVVVEFVAGVSSNGSVDRIAFFMHQTFQQPVRITPVVDGRASITLLSAGSFTIGALTSDRHVLKLPLDQFADLRALSTEERDRFKST